MSNKGNSTRKLYLDILKIFAIIFVIFNHTGNCGFMSFAYGNIFVRMLKLFVSITCKTEVPLFFVCSGAVLLNINEKF